MKRKTERDPEVYKALIKDLTERLDSAQDAILEATKQHAPELSLHTAHLVDVNRISRATERLYVPGRPRHGHQP